MKFTTHFGLRSQTTRLQVERNPRRPSTEQAFHLLWNPSQGEFKSTAIKEIRLLYATPPVTR